MAYIAYKYSEHTVILPLCTKALILHLWWRAEALLCPTSSHITSFLVSPAIFVFYACTSGQAHCVFFMYLTSPNDKYIWKKQEGKLRLHLLAAIDTLCYKEYYKYVWSFISALITMSNLTLTKTYKYNTNISC